MLRHLNNGGENTHAPLTTLERAMTVPSVNYSKFEARLRFDQAFSGAQLRNKPTSPGIPPGKLMIIALSL